MLVWLMALPAVGWICRNKVAEHRPWQATHLLLLPAQGLQELLLLWGGRGVLGCWGELGGRQQRLPCRSAPAAHTHWGGTLHTGLELVKLCCWSILCRQRISSLPATYWPVSTIRIPWLAGRTCRHPCRAISQPSGCSPEYFGSDFEAYRRQARLHQGTYVLPHV